MGDRPSVWISGVGAITPLGNGFAAVADALLAGRSGVRVVTHFDASDQPSRIAATLGPIPCPEPVDIDEFVKLGPWEQLLLATAVGALRDAGLWERRAEARIGLVLGIGSEWLLSWEAAMCGQGVSVVAPERDTKSLAADLAERLGITGPVSTVAAACASGNIALAQGRRWVEMGLVDACVAGACDRSLTPMGMAGFGNLGALSKRNEAPEAASRPFDRDRDGFVMGEAGTMFVLEAEGRARRRGAKAYGEIIGYGASSDAYHMVIPSPDPGPCMAAVRAALADADLEPGTLDYINAHATSTPVGDRFEAKVLQEALGPMVDRVPVSSTKSMTGHLLGATAAFEAMACLVAFDRGAIPPTINLDEVDPECGLWHVAHEAMEREVRVALSNSFGFGGSNTAIVLRKVA